MTDAVLGIDVRSDSARTAAENLNAIVPAADRAESAVHKMVSSVSTDLQAVANSSTSGAAAIEQMSSALDRSAAAARTASTSVRDSIDAMFAGSSSGRDRAADIAAYGAEMDALRAKFNPLFAAQQQYEGQLAQIASAERLGAISAGEAANARQRAAASIAATVAPMKAATAATLAYGEAQQRAAGQSGNLVAQFNDIGVMLQAGQSPMTLALQQGTQISQVLNDIGGKGSALKAIGGALLQMVNPISLITIGTIAAGAALFQFFTSGEEEAEKANEELEKQANLIRSVADEWGAAVPAVQAYADEVERASQAKDLSEAGEIINSKLYEDARDTIASLGNDLVALRGDLELIGGPEASSKIDGLVTAFANLEEKVKAGTATGEDAAAVQRELTAVMDMGGPAAEGMAASLGILAGSLDTVSARAQAAQASIEGVIASTLSQMAVNAEALAQAGAQYRAREREGDNFIREQERINGLSREQLELENRTASLQAEASRNKANLTREEATALAQSTIEAEKRRAAEAKAAADAARAAAKKGGGGGGGGSRGGKTDAEKEADKAVKAMEREEAQRQKVIEGLEFEISMIGKTALEKRILTEARRAHATATSEEGQQIATYVTQLDAADKAAERTAARQEYLASTGADLFRAATRGADEFKDALAGVGAQLADMLANQAFQQLFGGGRTGSPGIAGGLLSAVFGGLGGLGGGAKAGALAGGIGQAIYANGTSSHPGGLAMVHDGKGGEIIDLPTGARVYPADISREMARGGSQDVQIGVSVDDEGSLRAYVKRQNAKTEAKSIRGSVATMRKGVSRDRKFLRGG